jgi:hypothetical protein
MKLLRSPLATIVALMAICLSGAAEARVHHAHHRGHYGAHHRRAPALSKSAAAAFAAPGLTDGAPAIAARAAWGAGAATWRTGSDLVAEAARYVGSGKFTSLPGAWCADAVSFWLQRAGKPPLANRMAGAALSYGPRSVGRPGDLAVFMGRRGAYHVGVVVASLGDRVEVVSGNWGHRVGRAFVSRRSLIFVRT